MTESNKINDKLDNYLNVCIFLATLDKLNLNENDTIPDIYLETVQIQNSHTIEANVIVDDVLMKVDAQITESEYNSTISEVQ